MNEYLAFVQRKRLERVKAALEKNYMDAYIVETAGEVAPLIESLLHKGDTVTHGGGTSLAECGVPNLLRNGNYQYWDRDAPGVDKQKLYRESFWADAYLATANAITEKGEIIEMDGNANRVAALAFGPASVIIVAGINKIVPDIEAARKRIADIAAPAVAARVGAKTPCAITGKCTDCNSPERVCCTELILRQQRTKGRIKVILVMEALGL